jgi:hypothetical protein
VNATDRRPEDPVLEAAAMVGREAWDSTRAQLFDGRTVSVLVSPRRTAGPGASDVWITVVSGRGGAALRGTVAVTLIGESQSQYGRLDARGRCLIRAVPDGRYQIGLHRVPELGGPHHAAILPVPAACLDRSSCWTSGDGRLTARRLSDGWRTIEVEAADPASGPAEVHVGRVVDGSLELRRLHIDPLPGGRRRAVRLEFEAPGSPALVCLPLPAPGP